MDKTKLIRLGQRHTGIYVKVLVTCKSNLLFYWSNRTDWSSAGQIIHLDTRAVKNLSFSSICSSHLFRMQVYHLFGWFWLMNFIIALGQCALAGAFASYYWAWDKKTVSVHKKLFFCFFSVKLRESAVDSLCLILWFTVFCNLFFGFFHYLNALLHDWEMYCQTNFVVQSVSQDIPKFAVTASFFRTLR